MRTIKLIIEYDGTNYSGWQVQPNGLAVQQVVEEALLKVVGEAVRLRSSGRTDAGVHAHGMVATFTTTRTLPLRAFVEGGNRHLPPDIAILRASEVPAGFQPIQDALTKHYRYTIYNALIRSPLRRFSTWHVREPLDMAAMETAALHFAGTHDFCSFRASNCAAKTTVRRVDSVTVSRAGDLIVVDVIGEGFLKYMVRVMVGTLVDIGRGRFAAEYVAWLLKNPDRKKAGVTAPACGLCLIDVTYALKPVATFPPTVF